MSDLTLRDKLLKSSGLVSESLLKNLSEDITPNDPSNVSLGSEDKKFKAVYADEVHISQNTLYIGDTPVLGTNEETINIKADPDQNILIKTQGTGSSQMTSETGILLKTTGTAANINITADGTNSDVSINAKTKVSLNAPSIVLDGSTNINDLTVTGSIATVGSTNLSIKDNLIEINSGETGTGVTAGTAGIKVNRGDALPYMIQFDESDDMFKIGEQGDLETIASQNYVDEAIANVKFEHPATHPASMITGLATVATTGSYDDLSNKPTIPTSLPANGGNAATATKLESARNINGISFDGSADVKVPLEFHTCEVEDDNTNNYHHILSSGQCTSGWINKTITIVVTQNTNNAGLGILRCSLRTNNVNNNEVATGEITWLIRTGFSESDFCFNLRNTPKDTYMDVFYKASSTYMGLTWYVLTEGSMGTNNSEQWTKYNTNASGTNTYTEDAMKVLRTYTSTLTYSKDKGIVDQSNNAYYADESYKATKFKDSVNINDTPFDGSGPITTEKWGTARTLTIGNKSFTVNGGKDITWTLSEIGAVTKTEVDEAIANNAYTHPSSHAASMITGLATVATSGSYNDLSNKPTIPTSLPADGGNADTVNGHTVLSDVPANAKFTDTIYAHPSHTAKTSGLYKITVDDKGHVTAATAAAKSDITALGIPAQDTTYTLPDATSSVKGGVKVGSNITVSGGTISLTKNNVVSALGYTPPSSAGGISLSSNVTTTASTQSAISSVINGISVDCNSTGKSYTVPSVSTGITAGTRTLQNLLQELVNRSHSHTAKTGTMNCYSDTCSCSSCIIEGSVRTEIGDIIIQDLKVGDRVLGFDNKYHKVLGIKLSRVGARKAVSITGHPEAVFTDDHLLLIENESMTYDVNGFYRECEELLTDGVVYGTLQRDGLDKVVALDSSSDICTVIEELPDTITYMPIVEDCDWIYVNGVIAACARAIK